MQPRPNRQLRKILLITALAFVITGGIIGLSLISFKPQTVVTDASLGSTRNVMGKDGARLQLVEFGDYL